MPQEETQVLALHPAPVTYVPARSRSPRADLVETRSTVRLRHAQPDAFAPFPGRFLGWHANERLYRDAEALWSPLADRTPGAPPITVSQVIEHLERDIRPEAPVYVPGERPSDHAQSALYVIHKAFRETPANALARTADATRGRKVRVSFPYRDHASSPSFKGVAADLEGARSILRDGRGKAALALQAHLDRSVRIVGDEVFIRQNQLLCASWTGTLHRWEVNVNPVEVRSCDLLATAASLGVVTAYIERHGDRLKSAGDIGKWLAPLFASAPDEDVLRVVNGSCLLVRESVDRCLAEIAAHGPGFESIENSLLDLRDDLREAEMWAWMGAFGRDDPAVSIELLLKGADAALDAGRQLKMGKGFLVGLSTRARDLRELYLPLCRPEPPASDVEHLAGAGP